MKPGEVTLLDVKLGESSELLEEIVVEAKAERDSEAAILTLQRKSGLVQDGISSELISRAGDNDAAGAIKRVTGVSVEGGKFVYVRGLGDRYSNTVLNGAQVPGLDPNRNSVQMDLFPSNLIDNLLVVKTYSPDLPANFTGGYVDIITKDFPDRFTVQASASFSFNDQSTFNSDYLSYEGGDLDWLGFDDGLRELPSSAANSSSGEEIPKTDFNRILALDTRTPFLNQSYSFSIGDQFDVFDRPFGIIGSLSYRISNTFSDNYQTGAYDLTSNENNVDNLTPRNIFNGQLSSTTVLWGGLLNFSYKISDKNKISLNLIHNQSADDNAFFLLGQNDAAAPVVVDPEQDVPRLVRSVALTYIERSLSTAQLKAEHVIGPNNIKINWLSSFTLSRQEEPDRRFIANNINLRNFENGIPQDTSFVINQTTNIDPARYYRDLQEFNWDNKLDVTIPFKFSGRDSKIKTGAAFIFKDRDFDEDIFLYSRNVIDGSYNGDILDYIDRPDVFLRNTTQTQNSYTGQQSVLGLYLMGDVQVAPKLRVLAGLRYERTDIEVESDAFDENPISFPKGELDNNDILPAVNLTYQVTDRMNIRLGYSRTLARPSFRELAPFPSFDFIGDVIIIGNDTLERTLTDNFDLRWEMYPSPGELFSFSLFYKILDNPIGLRDLVEAANPQRIYDNFDEATVYGIEIEIRKNLGFISPFFSNFFLGTNVSLSDSEVNIPDAELNQIRSIAPSREDTRRLFNQSNFLINAFLNYDNEEIGFQANANFNVFGERLAVAVGNGPPDIFEQPRPTLDVTLRKRIGPYFSVRFRAQNLLNPDYEFNQEFKGNDNLFQSYQVGRSFSLGVTYSID